MEVESSWEHLYQLRDSEVPEFFPAFLRLRSIGSYGKIWKIDLGTEARVSVSSG
jgi:hypothetical protein